MSLRAREARRNGKFPKTDFRKYYNLTPKVFDLLLAAGIIESGEWHHTSSWGNETPFYHWVDNVNQYFLENEGGKTYEIYKLNKDEITKLARDKRIEKVRKYTHMGYVDTLDIPEDIQNRIEQIFEETI